MNYYVYTHKNSNGVVFYVGKGSGRRCYVKCSKRNLAWKNQAKNGYTFEIIKSNLSESEALFLEENLIKNPPKDWKLVNVNIRTATKKLDFSEIDNSVYYDESSISGLRWKTENKRGVSKHKVAGTLKYHDNGLPHKWVVCINRKMYPVHRIIYLLKNPNYDQSFIVNHIDFDPSNNKISNLELVTKKENNQRTAAKNCVRLKSNNTSGITGVSEHGNYYVAFYCIDGKITRKFFSKIKLGKEEAFRLAKQWRELNIT